MLVEDVVEQVKRQFLDEYDVIINDKDVFAYIYEAELDIIRRVGSNDSTTATTVGAFPSPVPDAVTIKRISINGKALKNISLEELDESSLSDTVAAEPVYWYTVNKTVHLWPQMVPSSTAVNITYNKNPTLMSGLPSANIFTVPANYHMDIKNFCLSRAFSRSGEEKKVQEYMELYDRNVGMRASEAETADVVLYKQVDPMDYEWL